MKICPVCNNECVDEAAFCPKCGADMSAVQPQQEAPAEQNSSFCRFCGRAVEPGTTFCPGCGGKLSGDSKPAGSMPPIIADTLGTVTGFVKKGPEKHMEDVAKSTSQSWIIFAGLALLTFVFSVCTNIYQFFYFSIKRGMKSIAADNDVKMTSQTRKAIREAARDGANDAFKYGFGVLWSFLAGLVIFFGISLLIFLAYKVIYKKNVNILSVFNVVAAASIPLTFVFIVNFVLGMLWTPFAMILTAVASIAALILLYLGAKSLAPVEKPFAPAFICCVAAVVALIILVGGIVISAKISGNAMGYIAGLGAYFGN